MPYDQTDLTGPFDIIGDVHGCFEELRTMLSRLQYQVEEHREDNGERSYVVTPPGQRKLVFVGDLIDRGPRSVEVARLVMDMMVQGLALCVTGNHDDKLRRHLEGRDVTITQGLAETLNQLDREGPRFRERLLCFLDSLPSHYVLDGGKLVVAHAGLREDLQGRESRRVRAFALYGETTGATDEYGLPVRGNWGQTYTGRALVVHGHTPVTHAQWFNRTLNIDTGCVFGGTLTALRYPENEIISVPSGRAYCPPPRPFFHHGHASSANLPVVDRSLEPRLPTPGPNSSGSSVEPPQGAPS
jgi:protein phosphatase